MGTSNYSDEFKRVAVHQITARGYPVREVSRHLGVSTHSLYKWMKLFGKPASKAHIIDHEAENRRLKREGHRKARHPKMGHRFKSTGERVRPGCAWHRVLGHAGWAPSRWTSKG